MNILIVDDEERVVLVLERILRQTYQVRVACSGTEALKIARREKPALILLDITMPGMDGLQVCQELRGDPALKDVPILMLTARGRIEDKLEGLAAGADDYLTKPFDMDELQLRIRALLRRAGAPRKPVPQDVLTLGQLRLNCHNYHLSTPEKTVLLTPVEFDLLAYLMRHPGQVIGSERLLREVWQYPSDIGKVDLVRMHIRNLRLKIEVDTQNPRFILTVPRHGYTLATE